MSNWADDDPVEYVLQLKADLAQSGEELAQLEAEVIGLRQENARLKKQVADLKAAANASGPVARVVPGFVKPARQTAARRRRGRQAGHEAAVRPRPARIDRSVEVELGKARGGRRICPVCRGVLAELKHHRRIVEDLIPAAHETVCYKTSSGYCVNCNRRVESRHADQPPAANLPHAQLGINTLTTALILRVRFRLPIRQITQLLAMMPGLSLSPAAMVKQLHRVFGWLRGEYEDLKRRLRTCDVVHGDETSWRIDGKNTWMWVFTDHARTLFHCDSSRGAKVARQVLGEAFGGTLVSDFYSAYDKIGAARQRCLAHLMREIHDTSKVNQSFAQSEFARRSMRWCKDLLKLRRARETLDSAVYARRVTKIESRLKDLAYDDPSDPNAARLSARLYRYRDQMTRCLHDEKVDPTNNAAERALRPIVVARKITGGHRSEQAAQAWAAVASLLATTEKQGLPVYESTQKLLRDAWVKAGR